MNNDELQKAIDDITRDSASAAPAESSSAETEALVNEITETTSNREGVKLEPALEIPVAPTPPVPEAPAMPPSAPEPVTPVVSASVAPEPVPVSVQPPVQTVSESVVSSEVSVGGDVDLSRVAREARKELYPLLDRVQMSPEEKFEICMEVSADDKNAFGSALAAARQIADETAKAEALLKIISATK